MTSLLNKGKEYTKMAFQYIKEKTGTTAHEVDPEYQTACEQFEIMKARVAKFIVDVNEILNIIPCICSAGLNFSSSLLSADQKSGGNCSELSNSFDIFFKKMDMLVKDKLLSISRPAVIDILKSMKSRFNELEVLRDERRKTQLLCDSIRDDLETISKSGTPEKVAKTRIEYEGKLRILEQQTNLFKVEMAKLWEQRFNLIEVPLQQLVGIVFLFCQDSFEHLQELQKVVTQEELTRQYPPSD
ncbi:hypothetical protein TRFO_31745 [Tritrichomonas foetus]|uniref:BAR domain-containing protein n=1 Tax=Tritrichomonas foetus TaxID=1144522 RepID=A0A1J4JRQ2_9EUKA|nr:hypothetical protein TRFO_31745 [Tritrichomonas foetus]|eukprot:OHT01426.1 hypothetical protein TRFO_31745 [Tritrichomonas foetus]